MKRGNEVRNGNKLKEQRVILKRVEQRGEQRGEQRRVEKSRVDEIN